MAEPRTDNDVKRLRLAVQGAVQGVGFRPTVFRLADGLGLSGWVQNSVDGALIEAEGCSQALDSFLVKLRQDLPSPARIQSWQCDWVVPIYEKTFEIRQSDPIGRLTARVLPDIAACDDCLREVFDPADRRYLYPFTNCTHCGPRFSIIEGLPYDRACTTMKKFEMCPACCKEYENPLDRRFHAQPNACPVCGPHVELWDSAGQCLLINHDAILRTVKALSEGRVVAVKGLGGFHLMVDARDMGAVNRLRERKRREEKPFAVMFPSLDSIKGACAVSPAEETLLTSAERPIVLLYRSTSSSLKEICDAVAPGNPLIGALLPYTPLHTILMRELGYPVVATSGNLTEEPICIDEHEALVRLKGLADLFLVHDRPIVRAMDDSVAQVVRHRPMVLRAARGYAPISVDLGRDVGSILATGGHMKNTVAITAGRFAVVGPHVGDLDTIESREAFNRSIESLTGLYETQPVLTVCDMHPDYASTQWARHACDDRRADRSREASGRLPKTGPGFLQVQHHHAHVAAVMAEHGLEGEVLGVSWDGTGHGLDGSIWGGEFLIASRDKFTRAACLRPFRLPGGEKAVREPRRAALGLLYEMFGESLFGRGDLPPVRTFSGAELRVLKDMLTKGVNAPFTSSAGRLFDAVAAILDLKQKTVFEGQAAMVLEFSADPEEKGAYALTLLPSSDTQRVDWEPLLQDLLKDLLSGVSIGRIAARFHNTLVESILNVALKVGKKQVVLAGGCFQNRFLLGRTIHRLKDRGFETYFGQRVPVNDGGLSFGQAVVAAAGHLFSAHSERS